MAEVTFVAGHAESQTEEAESQLPQDDRAKAEAAVKAAIDAANESEATETTDDKEPVKEVPKAKQEPAKAKTEDAVEEEDDEKSLRKILKNREKIAKEKAKASEDINRQKQEMQQYEARLRQYEAQLRADAEKYSRLRKDPVQAVRDVGWDPEEFITSLAREGTPEGKIERQLRELKEHTQTIDQWRADQAKMAQQQQQQWQAQQAAQARDGVEKQFKSVVLDNEKSPVTSVLFKNNPEALIGWGDVIAGQYRELTGEEASLEEIAEHIEEQLAEAAEAWYTSKVGAKGTSPKKGSPTQGAAKGKTLTQSGVSERSSLGKDIKDLDGDERLAAAREAVKEAFAASESVE